MSNEKAMTGGEALMKKLEDIAKRMGGGDVSIGFHEGATYPDGESVPTIAFLNEFGKKGQPPRPFFRAMIAKDSPKWPGIMGKLAKTTNYDGPRVLGIMGEHVKGALQESINKFSDPPLSPRTIAAKGFDKPLIDTAHMLNSVGYEVHES